MPETLYLTFGDRASLARWVTKLDKKLGYPNPMTKTRTYTEGISPRDPADKRWVAPVSQVIVKHLTKAEISRLQTRQQLDGFFNPPTS